MLQQLEGCCSLSRIAHEAALEEVDTVWAELIWSGELWWVALGDVVHNSPFIVQVCPRTSTCGHFEDHAPQ